MLDRSTLNKLIEHAPLAGTVMGVVVFLAAAAGGLLMRSGETGISRGDFIGKAERCGIHIDSPQPIDQISSADLKVIGSYAVRPPAGTLRLFTMTTPGAKLVQPQAIVETFDEERRLWPAEIHLPAPPRYSVFIVTALVGTSGAVLWDYYFKVAATGTRVPLDGPLPPAHPADRVPGLAPFGDYLSLLLGGPTRPSFLGHGFVPPCS